MTANLNVDLIRLLAIVQVVCVMMMMTVAVSGDGVTLPAPLTDQEKQLALARHNLCRCTVQPTAKVMPAVVWDPLLEAISQTYINTCPDSHNTLATTQYNNMGGNASWVGENLAFGFTDLNEAIDLGWCDEKVGYSYATNTCSGGACGHYTQVVWAETVRIGCSKPTVACPNYGGAYYICNYAVGGNWVGMLPYETGTGSNSACDALSLPQPNTLSSDSITLLRRAARSIFTFNSRDNITVMVEGQKKKVSSLNTTHSPCLMQRDLSVTATVSASSEASATFKAANVIDALNSTSWSPSPTKITPFRPQWIQLDLGSVNLMTALDFDFESLSSKPIAINLAVSDGDGKMKRLTSLSQPAWKSIGGQLTLQKGVLTRYVRLEISVAKAPVKLASFRVYGNSC